MRVTRRSSWAVLILSAGCSTTSPSPSDADGRGEVGLPLDLRSSFDRSFEQPMDAAAPPDAAAIDLAVDAAAPASDLAVAPDGGSYKDSLRVCWTDATCRRAMIVSHGGDWDLTNPYDSRAAMVRAVANGADGVKGDLRVTADGIAVVAHSSPIQFYESFDCAGQKIEQMTAAQVTACHLAPSATETFQRVDALLAWARGLTIVMLDVKVTTDLPNAIATGIAAGAQDDLFLEVSTGDFLQVVVATAGWDQLHYLLRLGNPTDVNQLLPAMHPQAFMYEMDPTYPNFNTMQMTALINGQLHPAGVRAFSSSDKYFPTVANHQMLFAEGFDVVMSYNLANGVAARIMENQSRGIAPP